MSTLSPILDKKMGIPNFSQDNDTLKRALDAEKTVNMKELNKVVYQKCEKVYDLLEKCVYEDGLHMCKIHFELFNKCKEVEKLNCLNFYAVSGKLPSL